MVPFKRSEHRQRKHLGKLNGGYMYTSNLVYGLVEGIGLLQLVRSVVFGSSDVDPEELGPYFIHGVGHRF